MHAGDNMEWRKADIRKLDMSYDILAGMGLLDMHLGLWRITSFGISFLTEVREDTSANRGGGASA
jgi:hypothetical protein